MPSPKKRKPAPAPAPVLPAARVGSAEELRALCAAPPADPPRALEFHRETDVFYGEEPAEFALASFDPLWSDPAFAQLEALRFVAPRWHFGRVAPWLEALERRPLVARAEFETLDGYKLTASRAGAKWELEAEILAPEKARRPLSEAWVAAFAELDPARVARVRVSARGDDVTVWEHYALQLGFGAFAPVEYPTAHELDSRSTRKNLYYPVVTPLGPARTQNPAWDELIPRAHYDPRALKSLLAEPDDALDEALLARLRACVEGVVDGEWSESRVPKGGRRKAVNEYEVYRGLHGERHLTAGMLSQLLVTRGRPATPGALADVARSCAAHQTGHEVARVLLEGLTMWLDSPRNPLPAALRALLPRVPPGRARVGALAALRGDPAWAQCGHSLQELVFEAELLRIADPAAAYEQLSPRVGRHLRAGQFDDAVLCAVTRVYISVVAGCLSPLAGGPPDPRWRAHMRADLARNDAMKYGHSGRQRAFLEQFGGS